MVDWLGTKSWMTSLSWRWKREWSQVTEQPFVVRKKSHGRFRSFGGFTFLQVFKSGHLVPMDQPEAALGMVIEFISEKSPWRHIPEKSPTVFAMQDSLPALFVAMVASILILGFAILMSRSCRKTDHSDSYVVLA